MEFNSPDKLNIKVTRKYNQGFFKLRFPEKYIGKNPNEIVWRSSWELKVMMRFDNDPNVLKWGSECTVIPYLSPVTGKRRRYFIDFFCTMRDKDGRVRKLIIEVKPKIKLSAPKQPKRMSKRYVEDVAEYATNQAKFEAAREYARRNLLEFVILTEDDLGITTK